MPDKAALFRMNLSNRGMGIPGTDLNLDRTRPWICNAGVRRYAPNIKQDLIERGNSICGN